MPTPIQFLTIIGVVFLFLAAFSINFRILQSGWFGLALIFLASLLPAFGLSVPVLLFIIAILLLIVIIVLLRTRPPA